MSQHQMDLDTDFCVRCGRPALMFAEDPTTGCIEGDNVIAISHIISRRRLEELWQRVCESR